MNGFLYGMKKGVTVLLSFVFAAGLSTAVPADIPEVDVFNSSMMEGNSSDLGFDTGFQYSYESSLVNFTSSERFDPYNQTGENDSSSPDNEEELDNGSENETGEEQQEDDRSSPSEGSEGDYIVIESDKDVVDESENSSVVNESRGSEIGERDQVDEVDNVSEEDSDDGFDVFPESYWETQDDKDNSITGNFSSSGNLVEQFFSFMESLFMRMYN